MNNIILLTATAEDKDRLLYKEYKSKCAFDFAISKYPDEFDIELIKQYGWYSAANRGNNMNGVSRDHMYSIAEGYKNHVDPSIISHPANCQLLLQRHNASKHSKCSITLNELLLKIKKWDEKYGPMM